MLYNIKIFSILTFINPCISSPSHLQPQNCIPYPIKSHQCITYQLPAIFHHHSPPYISYQLPANVGTHGCVRPLVRSPITPPLPRSPVRPLPRPFPHPPLNPSLKSRKRSVVARGYAPIPLLHGCAPIPLQRLPLATIIPSLTLKTASQMNQTPSRLVKNSEFYVVQHIFTT